MAGRKIISQIPRSFVAAAGTGGNPRLSSGLAGAPRPRPSHNRLRRGNPYAPHTRVTASSTLVDLFIPSPTMCIVTFFVYWGVDRMLGGAYEEFVKMAIKDVGEEMKKTMEEKGLSRFMVFGKEKTAEGKENRESGSAASED